VASYHAVWGNGNTGREAGVLGSYESEVDALRRCREFCAGLDNPAVGAWVRVGPRCQVCGTDDMGRECACPST
jgi:hypothetical protein